MPNEPWTEQVERIFTMSTQQRSINDIDDATLRDGGFSEEQLRDTFDDGFMTTRDDPFVTKEDRRDLREDYFYWMDYLGYNTADFDWDAWREWYESIGA